MGIAPRDLEDVSDRELRRRVRKADERFAALDASPEASREVVEEMETALQVIEAGSTELRRRRTQEVIAALPARRRLRDELDAQDARRRELKPARDAVAALRYSVPPEVQGRILDPTKLSHAEGKELLALVRLRSDGGLSADEQERFGELLGAMTGNADLFAQARRERELAAKAAQAAEQEQAQAIPERTYRGRGLAVLPPFLLDWVAESRDGRFVAADLGALALLLLALENHRAPFPGSYFDGETLVVPGGVAGLVLPPGANPGVEEYDASGCVRFPIALDTLVRNRLVSVSTSEEGLRIGPGERLT
jgi:hypothetical protein